MNAVGENEHPFPEATHELARRIELENRSDARARACVGTATLEDPDVARRVEGDRAGRTPCPVQLRPPVFGRIRRACPGRPAPRLASFAHPPPTATATQTMIVRDIVSMTAP